MNTIVPPIHESAEELKRLLKQEPRRTKQQRLHALYLLASGHARYRTTVAALLGVSRDTVGRWLTTYAQGGLAALLEVYIPAGKAPPLTADQLAQLTTALADPTGFASYAQVRQWIATTLGVQMTYDAVRQLVRYKLGAKLKVPRPAHEKKRRGERAVQGDLPHAAPAGGDRPSDAEGAGVGL